MDEFYKSIFAWIKVKKKKIKRMNVTFCIFESTVIQQNLENGYL